MAFLLYEFEYVPSWPQILQFVSHKMDNQNQIFRFPDFSVLQVQSAINEIIFQNKIQNQQKNYFISLILTICKFHNIILCITMFLNHVSLIITFISSRIITNGTLKRFFPSVDSNMYNHISICGHNFSTNRTNKFFGA